MRQLQLNCLELLALVILALLIGNVTSLPSHGSFIFHPLKVPSLIEVSGTLG